MGQGRRAANEEGRVGGIASSVGYRVKFSAEYKGPSRAWPKAGFTALLVNLAVCAYIFKTHFDPPGWKGSYCRRQFSIFSLYSTPVPSLPALASLYAPWLGCCFFFFSHGAEPRVPTNGYVKRGTRHSPELAPFSVRPSAKKGMHQLLPVFCPFTPLGDDASDGPIKLLVLA